MDLRGSVRYAQNFTLKCFRRRREGATVLMLCQHVMTISSGHMVLITRQSWIDASRERKKGNAAKKGGGMKGGHDVLYILIYN